MNWYKKAQSIPIRITSYNVSYNQLGISFNEGPTYIYYKVNPYWYDKINKLLGHKNYKQVEKILRVFGKYAPQKQDPDKPDLSDKIPFHQKEFPFMEAGNWFGKFLYAAIWDTDSDGSFEDNLKAMAELEYKLHALNTWPFSGMPQRQTNIAQKLEEEL